MNKINFELNKNRNEVMSGCESTLSWLQSRSCILHLIWPPSSDHRHHTTNQTNVEVQCEQNIKCSLNPDLSKNKIAKLLWHSKYELSNWLLVMVNGHCHGYCCCCCCCCVVVPSQPGQWSVVMPVSPASLHNLQFGQFSAGPSASWHGLLKIWKKIWWEVWAEEGKKTDNLKLLLLK